MADTRASFTNNNCLKYYTPNYDEVYHRSWRLISEKIIYLLKRGPQTVMTFEPLYSQIYRTVCAGKSEKMFLDLMALVSKHLTEVDETLGNVNEVSLEHFLGVSDALRDYIGCTKKITLLFSYFNKKYVFNVLSTDLFLELGDLFHRTILERRMPALMVVAEEALEVPCSFSPTIFHRFCHDVWTVCNRRFAVKYPRIFSRYRMRVIPEMKESDLENNLAEIREYEERLRQRLTARSKQPTERPTGAEETH